MEQIVIEGDAVTLLDVSVQNRVSLGEFQKGLLGKVPITTPILPKNTLLYAKKDAKTTYILQEEPTRRTLGITDWDECRMALEIPHCIFLVSFKKGAFRKLCVFFSKKRVTSLEDPLYHAPLFNVYSDGNICMGSFRVDTEASFFDKTEKASEFFWSSNFNGDVPPEVDDTPVVFRGESNNYGTSEGRKFLFEEWSKVKPSDILEVEWIEYGSLRDAINRHEGMQL